MAPLGRDAERLRRFQRVSVVPRTVSFPLLTPNSKGEKITAKAHGGPIDIEGVTVALVDDQLRLQSVESWFDTMEMFRQMVSTTPSALSEFWLLIFVLGSSRHS